MFRRELDLSIKQYKNKNGDIRYKFQTYLGVDPITNKPKKTSRQGFKTKREASMELARLKLETEKQLYGYQKKDYTYKEMFDLWNESHSLSIKESTQSSVDAIFRVRILPHFENMKLKKINTFYCQKVLNQWAKDYRSYKDIRTYFSMVMNHAVNLGLIDFNPMDRVITPKLQVKGKTKTGKYFETDELQKFLEYAEKECDTKIYTFFRLISFTGARKGEILALTWDDINFFSGELTINKTVYYLNGKYVVTDPKTKTSNRVIDLDKKTLTILKAWQLEQKEIVMRLGVGRDGNKNNLLFNRLRGSEPYQYIHNSIPNRELKKIVDKYKMTEISVHGFRHSHASLLFEAGLDVKSVQDRLGHSDVQTTLQIYTHVTEKMKNNSGEKFQKYVNF